MSAKCHSGIRTIHKGRIRLAGVTYEPRAPYHGELDGERCLFMDYGDYRGNDGLLSAVLWGSERLANTEIDPDADPDAYAALEQQEKRRGPGGEQRWYFWREVAQSARVMEVLK